ncbi:MAG: ribonuclease HII [Spirochaetaceae bacterium]
MMSYICGIDEAGRGPLAGPVTAAALILGETTPRELLVDSKKLSPRRRELAAAEIRRSAVAWGVGWVDHREIDAINIHRAALLAMRRAFAAVTLTLRSRGLESIPLSRVLVDGAYTPELPSPVPVEAIVGGDALIPEISGASILAKTARDRWMVEQEARYPGYAFGVHKGYPTKAHKRSIEEHGPSPIHRLSFRLPRSRSVS